jgi:uncharacterized Zn finger protein (UPF0148 family)
MTKGGLQLSLVLDEGRLNFRILNQDYHMSQCFVCGSEVRGTPNYCPTCGSALEHRKTEASEAGTPTSAKVNTKRVGLAVLLSLAIFGLGFFYFYITPSIHPVIRSQPVVAEPMEYGPEFVTMVDVPVRDDGNDLVISLSDVKQHRLVRFEYKTSLTTRSVMAYLARDGRLVTSISVSEHCGSNEFKIKESKIFCARCPSNWDMMTMEAYACCQRYYPDPIPSRVVGDEVRIAKSTIENWAGRL